MAKQVKGISKLNNWKIGTRIRAGFAILAALAAALGILSYGEVSEINRFSADISGNCLQTVYLVGAINANIQGLYGLVLQHTVSRDADQMAQLDAEIAEIRARNDALIAKYDSLSTSDEDRRLSAILRASRSAFWEEGERF